MRRLDALSNALAAVRRAAGRRLLTLLLAAPPSLHAQATAVTAPAASPAGTALIVPAGARAEDVMVLRGSIDVFGTVQGDVLTVSGDVTVHPGGRVTGDAVSLLGRVHVMDGAVVDGALRGLSGTSGRSAQPAAVSVPATASNTRHALMLVSGWLTVLLVIGLGVLVTASPYLDGVAEALEVSFSRALGVGLVGQMLVLPALLAIIVGLALTVVGVLAIPLAIVAFVFAVAGLVTLGFLAVAFVTGRSIFGGQRGPTRQRATSARGEALRAITVGVVIYLALWLVAAIFTTVPAVAVVLRTVALAATWVAATAGFGAALVSRAGTRSQPADRGGAFSRPDRAAPRTPYPSPAVGWQTPTPVHGVVAARRPAATGAGGGTATRSGRD